jgi:hypothetical protein
LPPLPQRGGPALRGGRRDGRGRLRRHRVDDGQHGGGGRRPRRRRASSTCSTPTSSTSPIPCCATWGAASSPT